MNQKVGIWIDHKSAVIVSALAGHVTTKTLESAVGAHPRFRASKVLEARRNTSNGTASNLTGTYDDVISQLVLPDALLIIGPGEAKLELKERLSRSKALSQCTVEIATAGRLTDPQIVAKLKEHFGIVR